MKSLVIFFVVLLFTTILRAQITAGIYTSNGPDNNPTFVPSPRSDFVGSNTGTIGDTLHLGATVIVPQYSFVYNSFANATSSNYYSHVFDLNWAHQTLFMTASRRKAVLAQLAADTATTAADTTDDEIDDGTKDKLVENLLRISKAVMLGGSEALILPADTSSASEEEDSTADTTAEETLDAAVSVKKDSVGILQPAALNASDSLQLFFCSQLDAVGDSLDDADGSEGLKLWAATRVRKIISAMLDSFPGDSTALTIRDSSEKFLARLQAYVPPVKKKSVVTILEAEPADDTTIYAPLSLPRESIFDWTQSDLTLFTTEDDTARYALELDGEYELRTDLGAHDSIGAHIATFAAVAHQANGAKVNFYEELSIANTKYATLDTLNNTVTYATFQTRWQPSAKFTGLFEVGYGVKNYETQENDSVATVKIVKLKRDTTWNIVHSATTASQALLGLGGFWRIWKPTSFGAMVYLLDNPANNARISANTYLVRVHGAVDISDDRYTYSGLNSHLFFKQMIFHDYELGLVLESAGRNYNQYAFQNVVKTTKLGTITSEVRTKNLRQDQYRHIEFQLTRTWYPDHFAFDEFTAELLLGYTNNNSNDPNFIFHDGYVTINLSVAL